jgi:hypothetical protein
MPVWLAAGIFLGAAVVLSMMVFWVVYPWMKKRRKRGV